MFFMKNGVLHIQKVEVPELDINVMSDLQQSYRTYIESTIYEDMQYLLDELHNYPDMASVDISVRVGSLQSQTFMKTQVRNGKYYYPVMVSFKMMGKVVTPEWEILRIPYMDDYGKINVDGNQKVVLSLLRAAEDISYSHKSNSFNISMPYANIKIESTSKSIKMKYGKRMIPMEEIMEAMLWDAGDTETRLDTIFTNTHLLTTMNLKSTTFYRYVLDMLNSKSDIISKLKSNQYKLGRTRDALNESLSLDRAIGQTLSRDVLNYSAGSIVTSDMVADFKRNQINVVYVQNALIPTGYFLADPVPMVFTEIPKGMKNSTLLRTRLPQYSSEPYIPEDVHLEDNNKIIISNEEALTSEVIEFLIDGGFTSLDVKAGSSKKVITFSFEREIVGNYTARLRELTTSIPSGRYADEWVYFYNNPDLKESNPEHVTVHDMIAIVSIMGEVMLTGKSPLLDRDTSFLKKVLLINEVFSETLRRTIKEFVIKYRSSISSKITGGNADSQNPFWSLTQKWISRMNDERVLSPTDTINLSAEVSQACHVNTLTSSSARIVDEQRHLAMPFFGRICPYETPAGKKLGIVNTKAIGARIRDGLLYAPYRKVLQTGNGIRISDKITWLSVKDELGCKFGDILSLKKDANGNYVNNMVLARIPNPDVSDEPFIFKNIRAFDLAGGYVSAVPEQFLSPTAALIPFACSDDPVRVSYGLSQIRQSVYLANSKKPRLKTTMYDNIFTYSDTVKYYMPEDGTITYIDNMRAEITTINGDTQTIAMQGNTHMGRLDATVELRVKAGDFVNKGVCIAEAHKYPQPFVVRAPYDGKIIEINDNNILIQRNANSDIVNLEECDSIAMANGRISGQSAVFLNIHVSVGDFVRKGQILADTCASREGVYSPSRDALVAFGCYGYNYEDGICATESAAVNYTSIIAHKIEETVNKFHYPYARAKSISGFKYCGPGDKIGSVTLRKSASEENGHERMIRATTKAHGIPFEVNTVNDDSHSRTYAYHVLGFNKLKAGDKMAGRHGNKGVVSKVLPDSLAPQLLNGKTVEFVLSPCGVPSRMNLGQIWDLHLGLVAVVLNVYINSDPFNGATPEEVEYLMRYTWTIANTVTIGDNIIKEYNRAAFDAVCSAFSLLPQEFHEIVWNNIENVIDWRGVFDPDGSATLYDPETDTFFDGKMTIGYPYFNKLMQEADEKLNVRAGMLEEEYARTSSQPQKGANSAKGQRMAEMELMALAAMGTHHFIREIINEKSDNAGRRINAHLKQLGLPERVDEKSCNSRSVENLLYLLEGCGVKVELPKNYIDISYNASRQKYTIDVMKLVKENLTYIGNSSNNSESKPKKSNTLADFDDLGD